ncbi:cytochrome b/b6 domain-containing protein, partial [Streptomyces sp. GC420]|uniref:cytochrome b/b6 domain-containing protein n=1 Tax=Streptomyces sp. GC420 TaxID=2697568 RepID=UPI001414F127
MNPRLKIPSDPQSGIPTRYLALTAGAVALLPVIVVVGGDAVRDFLNFGAGVVSLLTLSGAVVWGLLARDRVFLSPRHRLLAQGVHRATAILSVTFLILHVSVKLFLDHIPPNALVPFGLGFSASSLLITFGPLAAYCLITAAVTGAIRRSFIAPGGEVAAKWRAIHSLAYPAWSFALIHGLYAGRPAKTYVTVLYGLTMLGVAAAVSTRLLPVPTKRRLANRLLAVLQPGESTPGGPVREAPRDPSTAPLPGGGTASFSVSAAPGAGSRRKSGNPAVPRMKPPQPTLYEAPRRAAGLTAGLSGAASGVSDTGMSAAYRAVSGAAEETAVMPPQPGAPTAERLTPAEPAPFADPPPPFDGGTGQFPSAGQSGQMPQVGAYDTGRFAATGQFPGADQFPGSDQFPGADQFGGTGQFPAAGQTGQAPQNGYGAGRFPAEPPLA